MTDDLIAWLRAQLDEDERVALAADGGPWRRSENNRWIWGKGPESVVADPEMTDANAEHIARHDPARVLAEVNAKRHVLRLHDRMHSCTWPEGKDGECSTVRFLALPYADRPGYRDDWRP